MALKSTIFKASVSIADMDRAYYADHALTIAQHPSENDERMMVRLLAFVLNAAEGLAFGQGMHTNDEADLWLKDLTGEIKLWIDVGQPDPRLVRKASHRADRMRLYSFGRTASTWWAANQAELLKLPNLEVFTVPAESTQALAALATRTMQLSFSIQDEQIWVSSADDTIQVQVNRVTAP